MTGTPPSFDLPEEVEASIDETSEDINSEQSKKTNSPKSSRGGTWKGLLVCVAAGVVMAAAFVLSGVIVSPSGPSASQLAADSYKALAKGNQKYGHFKGKIQLESSVPLLERLTEHDVQGRVAPNGFEIFDQSKKNGIRSFNRHAFVLNDGKWSKIPTGKKSGEGILDSLKKASGAHPDQDFSRLEGPVVEGPEIDGKKTWMMTPHILTMINGKVAKVAPILASLKADIFFDQKTNLPLKGDLSWKVQSDLFEEAFTGEDAPKLGGDLDLKVEVLFTKWGDSTLLKEPAKYESVNMDQIEQELAQEEAEK